MYFDHFFQLVLLFDIIEGRGNNQLHEPLTNITVSDLMHLLNNLVYEGRLVHQLYFAKSLIVQKGEFLQQFHSSIQREDLLRYWISSTEGKEPLLLHSNRGRRSEIQRENVEQHHRGDRTDYEFH